MIMIVLPMNSAILTPVNYAQDSVEEIQTAETGKHAQTISVFLTTEDAKGTQTAKLTKTVTYLLTPVKEKKAPVTQVQTANICTTAKITFVQCFHNFCTMLPGKCVYDSDCTGGKLCIENTCAYEEGSCRSSTDCESYEYCFNSECTIKSGRCGVDSDCTGGKSCASASHTCITRTSPYEGGEEGEEDIIEDLMGNPLPLLIVAGAGLFVLGGSAIYFATK